VVFIHLLLLIHEYQQLNGLHTRTYADNWELSTVVHQQQF
jgi:hypothetical protein